jgi:hypothetical protein
MAWNQFNLPFLFFPSENLPSLKAERFKLIAADQHPVENRQQVAETAGRQPAAAAETESQAVTIASPIGCSKPAIESTPPPLTAPLGFSHSIIWAS